MISSIASPIFRVGQRMRVMLTNDGKFDATAVFSSIVLIGILGIFPYPLT